MSVNQVRDVIIVVLVPVGAAALVLFGGTYILVLLQRKTLKAHQGAASLLLAFSVLGVTVGFSTAYSRAPAVGAVLPALITLISGVLTYSVTKEGLAPFRPLLPHCITLLSLASLVGLSIGGSVRSGFDDYERQLARDLLRYEHVELESEKAKYLVDLEIFKQQKLAEIAVDCATSATVTSGRQGRPNK
jgi:hypothetical protein